MGYFQKLTDINIRVSMSLYVTHAYANNKLGGINFCEMVGINFGEIREIYYP